MIIDMVLYQVWGAVHHEGVWEDHSERQVFQLCLLQEALENYSPETLRLLLMDDCDYQKN